MARILFVNDHKDLAELVHMLLRRAGHEATAITDGRAAFQTACQQRPDLIILDWVLDGLTGEDVLRELRADPAMSRIPILVASALPDVHQRARLLGANGAIGKPFSEEELLQAVKDALDRARFASTNQSRPS
jgi:two-component system, OmpR family, phosphate regulon response regulator PhoB